MTQRIHKYRAYDKNNNVMLQPLSGILWGKAIVPTDYAQGLFNYELPSNYQDYLEGEMLLVDDVVILEYTGLTTKDGTEIYEGDILKITYLWDEAEEKAFDIVQVIWDKAGFNIDPLAYDKSKGLFRTWLEDGNEVKIEIIGNIYQQKDLLL